MKDGSSRYDDEGETLGATPPATKKQAAGPSAAKPAGKQSQPANNVRNISTKYFYCVFGGIYWLLGVFLRLQLAPVILSRGNQ